jgi:hypothetical protein
VVELMGDAIEQHAGDGAVQIGHATNINITYAAPQHGPGIDRLDKYQSTALAHVDPASLVPLWASVGIARVDGVRARPSAREPFASLAERYDRLAVVGGPGAGKTSSMLSLAKATRLCLFLQCGEYRENESPIQFFLALVARALCNGGGSTVVATTAEVASLLESTKTLIIFDAINEAPAHLREHCIRGIREFVARFKDQRYALTTRPDSLPDLPGWQLCVLSELDDEQLASFVGERSANELRQVLGSGHPVLRSPLFLRYAVRLLGDRSSMTSSVPRSRASLIHSYVRHLLPERDVNAEPIQASLTSLAQRIERSGQSLSEKEALDVLHKTPGAGDCGAMLEQLVSLGFGTLKEHHFRFEHPTIQEHFFAAALAKTWLASGLPGRTAQATPDDPDRYVHSHLDDRGVARLLPRVVSRNPTLALAWIDDLSLDRRCVEAANRALRVVDRGVRLSIRYSRLGASKAAMARTVLAVFCVAWIALTTLLVTVNQAVLKERSEPLNDVVGLLALVAPVACIAVLVHVAISYRGTAWACLALRYLPHARDERLRRSLARLAEAVEQTTLSSVELRSFARAILDDAQLTSERIAETIHSRETAIPLVRAMTFLELPAAQDWLVWLSYRDGLLGRTSFECLMARCRHFPEDLPRAIVAAEKIAGSNYVSGPVRSKARRFMRSHGREVVPAVELSGFLDATARVAGSVSIGLMMSSALFLASGLFVALVLAPGSEKGTGAATVFVFALLHALLVYCDARWILRARRFKGTFALDSFGPSQYALFVFLTVGTVGLLVYLYLRAEIARSTRCLDGWRFEAVATERGDGG